MFKTHQIFKYLLFNGWNNSWKSLDMIYRIRPKEKDKRFPREEKLEDEWCKSFYTNRIFSL